MYREFYADKFDKTLMETEHPRLDTKQLFERILGSCKKIFIEKNCDYGASWQVLRLPSITDQIAIKVRRIRSIQEKKHQEVDDSVETELRGIVNYAIMALMKHDFPEAIESNPTTKEISTLYDSIVESNMSLLSKKNHDYEEAWRHMRPESMVDIILMRVLRIKFIEDHQGKTSISEGVDANYRDIINYAVFCLMLMGCFSFPPKNIY